MKGGTAGELGVKRRAEDVFLPDTNWLAVQTRYNFNTLPDLVDSRGANKAEGKLISVIHCFEAV